LRLNQKKKSVCPEGNHSRSRKLLGKRKTTQRQKKRFQQIKKGGQSKKNKKGKIETKWVPLKLKW